MAKVEKKICICCGVEKRLDEFYKSYSPMFKVDGKLPICKDCVLDIYEENLQYYKSVEKALYKTLFSLDVYYDLKLAKKSIIDTYDTDKHVLKTYMSKINLSQNQGKTAKDSPHMNIQEDIPSDDISNYEIEDLELDPTLITKEMLMRWNEGREVSEYMFLENEYNTMCNTFGDRNPYSLSVYIQIALNRLYLREEWMKPNPDTKRIKDINESISKLAGDCKMKEQQIDNSEDDNMCFGTLIGQVETKEPIFNNPLFDDVDFIGKTFRDDFRHPFAQAMDIDDSGKKLVRKNKRDDENDNTD